MPLVVSNALCQCSFGVAPSPLEVLPLTMTTGCAQPAANISAAIPFANIKPFALCTTPKNPAVAAATTEAMGVLTPVPCTPVTTQWTPGCPTVTLAGMPALDQESTANCQFGGVILLTFPGEVTVEIP